MATPIINMWTPVQGMRIARHNNVVHLITQMLQTNKKTRFLTLTNVGTLDNKSLEQTIPKWLLKCTCPQSTCQCQAKLWPYILCILGALNQTQTPIAPSHTLTIQLIEFTSGHNRFLNHALTRKYTQYDPLFQNLQHHAWKANPLITITSKVRGAIHEHLINELTNLKIPKFNIKTLMKNIHQNTIKYLTYLVLNKIKLDNKQNPILPPQWIWKLLTHH